MRRIAIVFQILPANWIRKPELESIRKLTPLQVVVSLPRETEVRMCLAGFDTLDRRGGIIARCDFATGRFDGGDCGGGGSGGDDVDSGHVEGLGAAG